MHSRGDSGRAATRRCAVAAVLLWATACGAPPRAVQSQDSPPSTAQVRDGLGDDIDTQELRTSLFANWERFVNTEGRRVD